MEKQLEKNIQVLLDNLNIYYSDEMDAYNDRIKYILNELDSITTISNSEDIYLVSLIISEIRTLVINVFNTDMIVYIKKIHHNLDNLASIDDITKLGYTLNSLKRHIINYKKELDNFFNDRIAITKKSLIIDDFVTTIFNSTSESHSDEYDTKSLTTIQKTYISHLNGAQDVDSLADKYKHFLSRFRHFIKSKPSLNDSLPLKNNPVTQLLQLIHFSRTNIVYNKYICESDHIFLKAYFQSISDLDNIKIIDEKHCTLFTPKEYQTLSIALDDNPNIKQIFEYEIFAISHYFSDFDINSLLFGRIPSQEKQPMSNFIDLTDDLISLPSKLISIDKIYTYINKRYSFYDIFIGQTTYDVYDNSPAKILFDIANLYFHKNIVTATHINMIINESDMSSYERFEILFHKTINFINNRNNISISRFTRHMEVFVSFLLEFDATCEQALLCEDNLLILTSNNDFNFIQAINKSYHNSNYKKIIERSIVQKPDTYMKLENINKLVDSAKYEEAAIASQELVYKEIENIYYKTPTIIRFNELPPISHKISEQLNNYEDDLYRDSVEILLESNEKYWSV